MKKKNIKAEIQKLLRPDKDKKKKEKQKKPDPKEHIEPETEEQAVVQPEENTEPETEELAEEQPEEQAEAETGGEAEEQPEYLIGKQTESKLKKQINPIDKRSMPEINMLSKAEISACNRLAKQVYMDFARRIIEKYGFGRLAGQFSKLIFRQYSMMLMESQIKASAEGDTIIENNNNYHSNYYNFNKSVLNFLSQPTSSIYSKSYKEIKTPFYILKNFHLSGRNNSGYTAKNGKEIIRLMYRKVFEADAGEQKENNEFGKTGVINTLKIVDSVSKIYEKNNNALFIKVDQNRNELHTTEKKTAELKKRNVLTDRINKITQFFSEPAGSFSKPQAAEQKIKTIETQVLRNNTQNFFFPDDTYSLGRKLLHELDQQSELKAFVPDFLKPVSFEKKDLSNRTSIGSNIGIINRIKSESNAAYNSTINTVIYGINNKKFNIIKNEFQNRASNENNNRERNRTANATTKEVIYRTNNINEIEGNKKVINQTVNINNANESTNKTNNLIIKRTVNRAANGSSNIKINNNIFTNKITNRITNGIVNKTINSNSNGSINRAAKIITDRVINRTEYTEKEGNISPQYSLTKNVLAETFSYEKGALPVTGDDDEAGGNRQQNNSNEELEKSKSILRTAVINKNYSDKAQGFVKSALVQADSNISKMLRNFSSKPYSEREDGISSKKIFYQNKIRLIPADIRSDRRFAGFTEKQSEDNRLIFCRPYMQANTEADNYSKNLIKSDNPVFAKAVSQKPRIKINELEVEEVNQIAEKVFKILEKRIAIQKDRRGLG